MAYDSSYTGEEIDGAVGAVDDALPKSGGASNAMTGPLYLQAGDPTNDNEAVPKHYVDNCTSGGVAGIIFDFGGDTAPAGALICDGTEYDQSAYPELYNAIGQKWGGSSGTFKVPELNNGRFCKGVQPANVGTYQASSLKSHSHSMAGHTHSMKSHTHNIPDHSHGGATNYVYPYTSRSEYSNSLSGGQKDFVDSAWSSLMFTGDGTSTGTQQGIGIRFYSSNDISIYSKTGLTSNGPNDNNTGVPSTTNTGNSGEIDTYPANGGVLKCIWTGAM